MNEHEILCKKYATINQTCIDEPNVYTKNLDLLGQQNKDCKSTINNLKTDVDILKETNRKLQER